MTHKTKGIVLRIIKYGESSIIATIYTELFGVQSYMVKGVRQASKKSSGKGIYFQPAAMLDMVVYHNELKNLNFIKEYQWAYLYNNILVSVVKNAVAMYITEVMLHCLKQPEANPELFYLVEDTLKQLDNGSDQMVANLPLYFLLHLGGELGFRIQGEYQHETSVIDLVEGQFVAEIPAHAYYIQDELAKISVQFLTLQFYNDLDKIQLTRQVRRQLLQAYQTYIALHVQDFGELKSLTILQEVLA